MLKRSRHQQLVMRADPRPAVFIVAIALGLPACGGKSRADLAQNGGSASGGTPPSAGSGNSGGSDPLPPQSLPPTAVCNAGNGISFNDGRVEAEVLVQLGLIGEQEITADNVARISRLHIEQVGVRSLQGLECLLGLQSLTIKGGAFDDLSPLSGLKQLRQLYLPDGHVTSLEPLASVTGLDWLYLDNNSISDLTPLASLVRLRNLSLPGNSVRDVTPLVPLVSLAELILEGNPVDCSDPLQHQALALLETRIVQAPPDPTPTDGADASGFYGPCP